MATAAAASVIEAPIGLVWSVMLDTERYGEWNPFIVRIDRPRQRPLEVGDPIVLHVRWHTGGKVTSHERVHTLDGPDDGRRALLEYDYGGAVGRLGLVRGRRIQELSRIDDGVTAYNTRERLRGPLAWAAPLGPRPGRLRPPRQSPQRPRRAPPQQPRRLTRTSPPDAEGHQRQARQGGAHAEGPTWPHLRRPRPAPQAPPDRSSQ